ANNVVGQKITLNSDGSYSFVNGAGKTFQRLAFTTTYSGLPVGLNNPGEFVITDSPTTVPGAIVTAGGGSNTVKGFYNNTNWVVEAAAAPVNLTGTTGSIGGSALTAGNCASGTVGMTGATTSMAVETTPATYPGDQFFWKAYVSAAGTVTVKVCTDL